MSGVSFERFFEGFLDQVPEFVSIVSPVDSIVYLFDNVFVFVPKTSKIDSIFQVGFIFSLSLAFLIILENAYHFSFTCK